MLPERILFMTTSRIYQKKNNFTVFKELTKRHFLVFFKSKITILYTLMVPIIVLVIYILFLRELEFSSVKSVLDEYDIVMNEVAGLQKGINAVIDSWMMGGILSLTSITVSIQTNYIFVRDKDSGINRDFASSPINNNILICSYFVFNFLVTLMIDILFLFVCMFYLGVNGEFYLNFVDFLAILGTILLSVGSATLITVFLCSFIKKENSLSSIIAIFSTATGFLIGAYMPMSMLPKFVANICGFLPGTYATGLFRYSFLKTPFANLEGILSNVNNGPQLIEAVQSNFGFDIDFFGLNINPGYMILILLISIVIFSLINVSVASNLIHTKDKIMSRKKSK